MLVALQGGESPGVLDAPADDVDDSMLLYQQPGIHQRSEKFNVRELVSKSAV